MKKFLQAAALAAVAYAMFLGFAAAPALADYADCTDRRIVVINHSSETIYEVTSSNRDASFWSGNHLGTYDLDPGEEMTIDVDDGTGYHIYDLFASAYGGYEAEVRINACVESHWIISDDDLGGDF